MPRDGTDLHPETGESPTELLAKAARMHQYARNVAGTPLEALLDQFADELEARSRQAQRFP